MCGVLSQCLPVVGRVSSLQTNAPGVSRRLLLPFFGPLSEFIRDDGIDVVAFYDVVKTSATVGLGHHQMRVIVGKLDERKLANDLKHEQEEACQNQCVQSLHDRPRQCR